MSGIVIPIHDAGTIPLVDIPIIAVAGGSLRVRASDDLNEPGLGSLNLAGEFLNPAPGSLKVRGTFQSPALSQLGVGVGDHSGAGAALDAGRVLDDPGLATAEISGESVDGAGGSLETRQENSITGSIIYLALASLSTRSPALAPALASIRVRGKKNRAAGASLVVRDTSHAAAAASLDLAHSAATAASAALDTGGESTYAAGGALDAEDGYGVDLIIEVADSILAGGHGDC